MVPAGNKATRLSSVNHTTKTIHHQFIIIYKQLFQKLHTHHKETSCHCKVKPLQCEYIAKRQHFIFKYSLFVLGEFKLFIVGFFLVSFYGIWRNKLSNSCFFDLYWEYCPRSNYLLQLFS